MNNKDSNSQELSSEIVNDGIAHIKKEFIIPIISKSEKKEEIQTDHKDSIIDINLKNEFPNKKKKGANRHRPKLNLEPSQNKLCRNYWCLLPNENPDGKCTFDNCPFSHNVEEFLKNKPQDLGDKCHNFDTYGFCAYGIVCRYGSSHIESNGSVINYEKQKADGSNPPVRNTLKKELQKSLRKRNYDFSKSHKAFNEAKHKTKLKLTQNQNRTSEHKENDKNFPESKVNAESECLNESEDGKKMEGSLSNGVKGNKEFIRAGPATDEDLVRLRSVEKKKISWSDKLYLAPLTTLGNLPFRRVCKRLGADITCSEMALSTRLLQATNSEWALVKRHSSEDIFGVQLCGSNVEAMIKSAQLLNNEIDMDFVDINMGCPIDMIFKQGAGSALMRRVNALEHMVLGMNQVLTCPITLKMRTGIYKGTNVAHNIIEKAKLWDVNLFTVHGRSKEQRYLKSADWNYIKECVAAADPVPLFGNGDILTYEDYYHYKNATNVSGIMVARGALIKPWIFTEIKEKRHWDISSGERLDILREFVNNGMEHWGSDTEGVEKTRRFLLEWLSFLYRYIPVGVLEHTQKINQRPPQYKGRNDLETLMSSPNSKDWIKISEMLLGNVPQDFEFLPKHKANSWS